MDEESNYYFDSMYDDVQERFSYDWEAEATIAAMEREEDYE
jgi:hypothetical protein